ncbi:MAG: glycosyltransferase family 4 protein [Rhodobacteraceae bacterium]|nr:glycosyltransferase family 4 protein [Paracoccaceae bacterium]
MISEPRNIVEEPLIVAIGSFPPPVTGESKNLKLICDEIKGRGYDLICCNTSRGSLGSRWLLLPRRTWRYSKAWGTLIASARKRTKTVYLTSDGGPGLLFTLLAVLIARTAGFKMVLQHRTFQYVRERSRLASAVNHAIGDNGLHVFLSEGMARNYFEQYSPQRPFRVNHNFAQVAEFSRAVRRLPRKRGGPLRVGYLSNLMLEKGFDTFLEVARRAVREGLEFDFIIAGPAPGATEENLVKDAIKDLGGRLEWRGAVYGDDKMRFFRDIDIFMFPTRYHYEAQPNVVLEALAAGNYVIATDLGCVSEDLSGSGGEVVPFTQVTNPAHWVARLKPLLLDRSTLMKNRATSAQQTRESIIRASVRYHELLLRLSGAEDQQCARQDRAPNGPDANDR